jgi:hypothetical protein
VDRRNAHVVDHILVGPLPYRNGNPSNPKCSRFVVTPDGRIFHQCCDSDCRNVISRTRIALRALKLEHVLLDEEELPDDVDLYAADFVDKTGQRLLFPESCMHGKAGALARKTECPREYRQAAAVWSATIRISAGCRRMAGGREGRSQVRTGHIPDKTDGRGCSPLTRVAIVGSSLPESCGFHPDCRTP